MNQHMNVQVDSISEEPEELGTIATLTVTNETILIQNVVVTPQRS